MLDLVEQFGENSEEIFGFDEDGELVQLPTENIRRTDSRIQEGRKIYEMVMLNETIMHKLLQQEKEGEFEDEQKRYH